MNRILFLDKDIELKVQETSVGPFLHLNLKNKKISTYWKVFNVLPTYVINYMRRHNIYDIFAGYPEDITSEKFMLKLGFEKTPFTVGNIKGEELALYIYEREEI